MGGGRWIGCTPGDVTHVVELMTLLLRRLRKGSHNGDNAGQVDGKRKEMKRMAAATARTYIILTSYIIFLLWGKLKLRDAGVRERFFFLQ